MEDLTELLKRNEAWANSTVERDPDFFKRLVAQQKPQYLWIGCSDSRVPANQIVDLDPGQVFVHRNVANVVSHSDTNAQSVIQFAVQALGVRHIMVVGHYGCGGVHAALTNARLDGPIDAWLGHVREVAERHKDLIDAEPSEHRRAALLCELNVLEQAIKVCNATPVRKAWEAGKELTVHGWIYKLGDGKLRHLDVAVSSPEQLEGLRERAVKTIAETRRKYYAARD